MRFVHSNGYTHCDLHPSNILINAQGHSLISDFGTALLPSGDATTTSTGGTFDYAALELFEEGEPCTGRVDVFSFGSIVYEILSEKRVFPCSMGPLDVLRALRSRQMPLVPGACGYFMQNLIRSCWSHDSASRPSFHAIIESFQREDFEIIS
jgi:serine/threonine protein kinase